MSIRNMDSLFEPGSVAILGASQRPDRMGTAVMNNMAESGFAGAIWPVNPKYGELLGIPCYPKLSALPRTPDLAIICTPPDTIAGLVADLGARGTRGAVVLTPVGGATRQAIMKAARPHLLRVLGPGGIGLVAPLAGLNASVAHVGAKPGKIAFISQSAMVMTAVLDWARQHGIGFSRVVSLVEGGDIDLGDMLDFLAADDDTAAIVMHIETVTCARKFMSAARLAARGKPVVVLKAGRSGGDDKVIDAAIRRAGMLRVHSSADLFDAVETVAHVRPLRGERLAIMSNGSGPGTLAADALGWVHGKLAELSADSVKRLHSELPAGLAARNPIDIGGEASAERHAAVLQTLLADPQADALLLVHGPSSAAGSTGVAQALAPLVKASSKNVFSCWLGGAAVAGARQVFADAGLPAYDTPEKAVRAFAQVVQYNRNQALLIEVPGQAPAASVPERQAARARVEAAYAARHSELAPGDLHAVLAAYGIALAAPAAQQGAAIPPLHISMRVDAVFGPVISVGLGGLAGGVVDDRAIGVPPLNMVLARDMLERSRAGRAWRDHGDEVCRILIQLSELVADIGEIAAVDIGPLEAGQGATVARIELGPRRPESSLAIRPYPQALEQEIQWQGAPLVLRPIRPEDAPAHVRFFSRLAPDDVRLRFFSAMKELPPAQLARLTQIDYDRAMAFIATRTGADGEPETLGVVRAVADPDNQAAEFAIIVRSDLKGLGLGNILFQKLLDYFRSRGTRELTGEALSENIGMQQLMRRYGGSVTSSQEAGMVDLRLALS